MASPFNEKSIRAAERMGLRREGVLRWSFVLPASKEGKKVAGWREEVDENDGRDSVILAMCWDDWEKGGREHVEKALARKE